MQHATSTDSRHVFCASTKIVFRFRSSRQHRSGAPAHGNFATSKNVFTPKFSRPSTLIHTIPYHESTWCIPAVCDELQTAELRRVHALNVYSGYLMLSTSFAGVVDFFFRTEQCTHRHNTPPRNTVAHALSFIYFRTIIAHLAQITSRDTRVLCYDNYDVRTSRRALKKSGIPRVIAKMTTNVP